jgi:hypothetical protein
MSPFLDELEDQLREAARARSASDHAPAARRAGVGWLHAGLRAAPVLAAALVALAVVGGAFVLLRHHGHGTPSPSAAPPTDRHLASLITHTPPRQLHQELSYIAAATRPVLSSRACQLRQPNGVSMIQGAPGAALVSVLGVLRQPATSADRLAPAALAGTPDVYAGHIRRALTADGVSYFVVPARYDPSASVPSERCFSLQIAALQRALPKLQPDLRNQTRVLQSGLIAQVQRQAARAPHDTVCLVTVTGRSSGAQCGITATEIKRGLPVSDYQSTFLGLVPNGVASVTLRFSPTQTHPARSVTGPVTNNVFAVRVPWANPAPSMPAVAWHATSGRVIKRGSVTKPRTVTDFCKQRPIACVLAETAVMQSSPSHETGYARAQTATSKTATSAAATSTVSASGP